MPPPAARGPPRPADHLLRTRQALSSRFRAGRSPTCRRSPAWLGLARARARLGLFVRGLAAGRTPSPCLAARASRAPLPPSARLARTGSGAARPGPGAGAGTGARSDMGKKHKKHKSDKHLYEGEEGPRGGRRAHCPSVEFSCLRDNSPASEAGRGLHPPAGRPGPAKGARPARAGRRPPRRGRRSNPGPPAGAGLRLGGEAGRGAFGASTWRVSVIQQGSRGAHCVPLAASACAPRLTLPTQFYSALWILPGEALL